MPCRSALQPLPLKHQGFLHRGSMRRSGQFQSSLTVGWSNYRRTNSRRGFSVENTVTQEAILKCGHLCGHRWDHTDAAYHLLPRPSNRLVPQPCMKGGWLTLNQAGLWLVGHSLAGQILSRPMTFQRARSKCWCYGSAVAGAQGKQRWRTGWYLNNRPLSRPGTRGWVFSLTPFGGK